MAAVQRKLVHKQFNSPLGLYSPQNVKETLDRELYAFGAEGIEVDPEITKPLNLANSAVLRAVEEEEQIKCGYKRVAWPPVSEERVVREFTPQPTATHYPISGQQQQYQPTQQHQPQHLQQQQQQQLYQQPTQYQQQPNAAPANQYRATSYDQYQQQPPQYQPHQSLQPAYSRQPSYQQAPHQQQQQQQQPSWAHNYQTLKYQPVQAPHQQAPPIQQQYQSSPINNYQTQPYHPAYSQQQPQYSSVPLSNQYNSYSQNRQQEHYGQDQPDQRAWVQPHHTQSLQQDYRSGSPGIITLRKETPVTQKPSPVYNAQPAAISLQGGNNMRGDMKWPPQEYKEAAARENEERRMLALGPVCRPRKVNRDYAQFFAKNALNSYYPSYKVPPGTQHMLA